MHRSTSRTKPLFLVAALLAAGASACVDDGAAPADDGPLAPIASVDGKDGRVRWYATDDGTVMLTEVSSSAAGPAERLVEGSHATPLEVFLALAPADEAVPPALLVDHARVAGDASPRALTPPAAEAVESLFDWCNSASWVAWHAGATAGYDHRSAQYNATAGNINFTGYITDQWMRRFDVCAGVTITGTTLPVYVDRKTDAAAVYTNLITEQLLALQHFYYTSANGPYNDWRVRVVRPGDGMNTRHYGVGGAWTPYKITLGQ